jgi:deoxycytidylate deaminase
MFLARAAALRSLDLSRQVGAAIFSSNAEILALGSNEVPKAGGGTYWSDDNFDDRDYVRKVDSNFVRKREILLEILSIIDPKGDIEKMSKDKRIQDSLLMDALEYGRVVHAEMGALSDAARLGHQVKDGVLYCTTFPCHLCAKHIVAAGIARVVFLEPYPKSLAPHLHSDSISIEAATEATIKSFHLSNLSISTVFPLADIERYLNVSREKVTMTGGFLSTRAANRLP